MPFCKTPLSSVTRQLCDVAMGRTPAELVIVNARLVNVCTAEIQFPIGIAISEGRIALVGDASGCVGEGTRVIDAKGAYVAPGFLDGHIHVESSMMSAGEYARAVVPHGTTGIFPDPHEICNVLGLNGVRLMIEDSLRAPLKVMQSAPSCVPAVPGFEDTGAAVSPEDVAEMMRWSEIVALGEMMNYPGVLSSAEAPHAEIAHTLEANKTVTGHYPVPCDDAGLCAYVASGVRCCHESTRAQDALAKMRLGMYAMLREGSAWHDLEEVSRAITQTTVDTRYAVIVSDDAHPHTLMTQGHMDHILRRAVSFGIDPITAIQMITINCAQCFHMDQDLGSVAPGKCADLVFLEDLEQFRVLRVLIDGEVVAENGVLLATIKPFSYPEWATGSVHIAQKITPETFRIPTREKKNRVRTIEVIPGKVGTIERFFELPVKEGFLLADPEKDVLKAAVFERHHSTGKVGYGFVTGFGIRCGAMASTVAHDAHNLLVVGTNDEDMALAANTLVQSGGGLAVVSGGRVLGHVPLPIAGLMNDKSAAEMSNLLGALSDAWIEIGCTLPSPFMTMALIPLACLPELRLTDRGLVDCRTYTFSELFSE